MLDQMDRSWVHGTLFSTEHIDGVKQFMSFIEGKFSENVEISCPCGRCLNQKYLCQPVVRKHILMNGMDSTYTGWIHHGESIGVELFSILLVCMTLVMVADMKKMTMQIVWKGL